MIFFGFSVIVALRRKAKWRIPGKNRGNFLVVLPHLELYGVMKLGIYKVKDNNEFSVGRRLFFFNVTILLYHAHLELHLNEQSTNSQLHKFFTIFKGAHFHADNRNAL